MGVEDGIGTTVDISSGCGFFFSWENVDVFTILGGNASYVVFYSRTYVSVFLAPIIEGRGGNDRKF